MTLHRPIVAVTRDEGPTGAMGQALEREGLEPFHVPAVRVEPPTDWRSVDDALARLGRFDWLVFTSRRGVEALLSRGWTPHDVHGPRPKVAAAGASTAAFLVSSGAPPDVVAEDAGSAGLAVALEAWRPGGLAGRSVLWPRSDRAQTGFAEQLAAHGARVAAPVAYQTVPLRPRMARLLRGLAEEGRLAAITFLSPSAAHGLAASFGERGLSCFRGRTAIASIGPTTSAALRGLGAPADVEPEHQTIEALTGALGAYLRAAEVRPA